MGKRANMKNLRTFSNPQLIESKSFDPLTEWGPVEIR